MSSVDPTAPVPPPFPLPEPGPEVAQHGGEMLAEPPAAEPPRPQSKARRWPGRAVADPEVLPPEAIDPVGAVVALPPLADAAESHGPPAIPAGEGAPISYGRFGDNFIRRILHTERVLRSIDRLLGEEIHLGPMKAGPGRVFATITAVGTFRATYGHEVEGAEHLTYRVYLPIDVDFELDLSVDMHRFHAEVLVPLTLIVTVEEPLVIVWNIVPPDGDEVTIRVVTDKRRSALLQKAAGLDGELRRFLTKVVSRELTKPHIQRATRIDMLAIIDGAWAEIAGQFLPNGPEDRLLPPGWVFPDDSA